MSNPSEGIPEVRVVIHWDRINGTFDSEVTGDDALVAVVVVDEEGVTYANDTELGEDA
jgi:hypothetical protein